MTIELTQSKYAYLYGFLLADGNLSETTRNRGKISIELSIKDKHILEEFDKLIPYNSKLSERTRDTNFKTDYESCILKFHSLELRTLLKSFGFPLGKKSHNVTVPNCSFSRKDFWRGIIDGDGSLGISSDNRPFISLFTMSESLCKEYIQLIFDLIGKRKIINRNERDNGFNIITFDEDAQIVINYLYYDNCFCLDRKLQSVNEIKNWKRPKYLKKKSGNRQAWNSEQDLLIQIVTLKEACKILNRSEQSIKARLWRIKKRQVVCVKG